MKKRTDLNYKLICGLMSFVFLFQSAVFADGNPVSFDPQGPQQNTIDPDQAENQVYPFDNLPHDASSEFLMSGGLSPAESESEEEEEGAPSILLQSHHHNDVPDSPAIVSVKPNDTRLFVRDRNLDGTLSEEYAFTARGVNWSPSTAGAPPQEQHLEFARWYQIDIPMMAAAGINVVRVYHDFGTGPEAFEILDMFYEYGIKVIMAVDSPVYGTVASMSNISTVVNAYKDHPAILMWAVGNEWDLNHYYGVFASIQASMQFTETAAQLIKSLDSNHPVSTVIAEPDITSIHPFSRTTHDRGPNALYTEDIVKTLIPSVDVWGINIYRGNSFQNVFNDWRLIMNKPMFIGEFGADSYDHRDNAEDQEMQADFNAGLWDEIFYELSAQRISGATIGAFAFEWNDEWWKNGSYQTHNVSFEGNYGQPDLVNDEEWFGMVDIYRNPKALYDTFRDRFINGRYASELYSNPLLTARSKGYDVGYASFGIEDKNVYFKNGGAGGGRGISVAVLDTSLGIRMSSVKTFDTYLMNGWGGPHYNFPAFTDYLNSLPDGAVISIAIGDEGGFRAGPGNGAWTDPNVEAAYKAIEALGSTKIRTVEFNGGWAMIVVKGQGVLAEEVSLPGQEVNIQARVIANPNRTVNLVDTFAPAGLVTLNDGATATNSLEITADIDAVDYLGTGIEWMCYSINDSSPCTNWERYEPQTTLTLPGYQGTNYINVRLRDRVGNEAWFWDSIVYDVAQPTGSITINNGQTVTNSQNITVQITADDAGSEIAEMSFAVNSLNANDFSAWETFNASKNLTLPNYQGTNYVNVRVRDRAGNVRYFFSSITLDKTAPQATLTLNNGAAFTNQNQIALQLAATDNFAGPLEFSYAVNGTSNFSVWETVTPTKNITLDNFEGANYINIKVRDRAGNETFIWKSIVLDKTAPVATVVSYDGSLPINNGKVHVTSNPEDFQVLGADAVSGPGAIRYSLDGGQNWVDWRDWRDFIGSIESILVIFPGAAAIFDARFQVRDKAGNVSASAPLSIYYNTPMP